MTLEKTPFVTTVLNISGHEFSTKELTSLVDVEPTEVWHQKHEWIKLTHPDFATIGWVYKLERQRKWSLGEAVEELLNVFWSKRTEICEFISKNHLLIEVRCIPFGDASRIEYIIEPEVIKKLAFFNASLSLAVYSGEK